MSTEFFRAARRALTALGVACLAAVAIPATIASPAGADPAPGTVVITLGEASGSYFAGFCADPGLPVAGQLNCSDGHPLVGGPLQVSAGTPRSTSLPAGTYRAAIGNPSPPALGAIGPVEVIPGQSITCTFTLAAAPSCIPTPGPAPGTLVATVDAAPGSYWIGLCADPGLPTLGLTICSDNRQLVGGPLSLAAGAALTASLPAGTYHGGTANGTVTVGSPVGAIVIASGQTTSCTFTMTDAPECAITAVYSAVGTVTGGDSVSTVPGTGQTAADPIGTSVTTPDGGTVAIVESTNTSAAPPGYSFFGQQVTIAAPTASVASPLSLTFHLDPSIVPVGQTEQTIQLFRDGVAIAECTGAPAAIPDPCIAQRELTAEGDIVISVLSSHASVWTFGVFTETTAPTIQVTTPSDDAVLVLNSVVPADYACTDEPGGSGVLTCDGTSATGAPVDTSSPGAKSFTVTASDRAGNTVEASIGYSVQYAFEGFRAPIGNGQVNAAKAGQAIPVKWRVTDALGSPVSDPTSFVSLASLDDGCAGGTVGGTTAGVPGGSGVQYKGSGEWQVNWKTDKAWKGQCRTLALTLGDGTVRTAELQFK